MKKYRLKLRENKDYTNGSHPQYSLKYKVGSENPRHVSFSILSALIGNNDVVVMLSSDFIQNSMSGDQNPIEKFMDAIQPLGLFLNQRRIPTEQNMSILGIQMRNKKKVEIHEVAVYVPNHVWKEHFRDILPVTGARYGVMKEPMSVTSFINGFFNIPEDEQQRIFQINVFDLTVIGQMGITATELDFQEISRLLEI